MTLVRAFAVLSLFVASSAAAKPDKAGCVDHPLFKTRMPEYALVECSTKEFDSYGFRLPKGKRHNEEGRFTSLTYQVESRQHDQSGIAVVRNYENAITQIGGTILERDANQRWVNGKVLVDGKEVFVEAEKGNGKIWLRIIEKVAMTQHIVADAASFSKDLRATGHVAVYGIYFDTGKSVLKAESGPAIEEIAKLLKTDAALKLWVVGHTDSVGEVDPNVKLAQARADAVVTELTTRHGITAARLKSYGVGPFAPVASNDAEDGKAKNRRVELVKCP